MKSSSFVMIPLDCKRLFSRQEDSEVAALAPVTGGTGAALEFNGWSKDPPRERLTH